MNVTVWAVARKNVKKSRLERPARPKVEAAVRLLIERASDDLDRESLVGTPARVARAYEELFARSKTGLAKLLGRTFEMINDYDDIVALSGIRRESHCERHSGGVRKPWVSTVTGGFRGVFKTDDDLRQEFLASVSG